jgi:hypothetical protein
MISDHILQGLIETFYHSVRFFVLGGRASEVRPRASQDFGVKFADQVAASVRHYGSGDAVPGHDMFVEYVEDLGRGRIFMHGHGFDPS